MPYVNISRILLVLAPLCVAACSTSAPVNRSDSFVANPAAIAGTQKIIDKAAAAVAAVPDARSAQILLEDANNALNKGDVVSARRLARSAKREALTADNTVHVRLAKRTLSEVKSYTNLNAQQYIRLRAAENALVNNDGAPASQLLTGLNTQLELSSERYAARRKATRPQLVGYQQVVNNPFQWPLLMKASYALIQSTDSLLPTETQASPADEKNSSES